MIPVFGDVSPPPIWATILCIAIGAAIALAGSITLGAILIGAVLFLSAPRLLRRDR